MFNVTAMERSILAELSERGGRGQLSRLKDRRPIERLVNKGFVERHTLNDQREEYVLTAIGKKVLNKQVDWNGARTAAVAHTGETRSPRCRHDEHRPWLTG